MHVIDWSSADLNSLIHIHEGNLPPNDYIDPVRDPLRLHCKVTTINTMKIFEKKFQFRSCSNLNENIAVVNFKMKYSPF